MYINFTFSSALHTIQIFFQLGDKEADKRDIFKG